MRSIVSMLAAFAACQAVSVHGRRAEGQRHLRSAGSMMSSTSVHASSRHQSRDIYRFDETQDNWASESCDVSVLAARKPATMNRLRRGEILHSTSDPFDNALVKDSTYVWLRADCKLIVSDKDGVVLFQRGRHPVDHCALLLTDASCSTQGDLAIIDTDTGKYLWRVQSSVFTPKVDTFQVQGDGNAVLLQEGAQLLWSTKRELGDDHDRGYFHFDLEVREDVHSLQCDTGALQSSYHQVTDGDVLSPGELLRAGAALREGQGERFPAELRMQRDCNLVVYRGGEAVFATNTKGKGTEGKCALVITGDGCDTQGDLAIVDSASGQYIWRVPTSLMDPGIDTFRLQGDGNAVLFQQGGAIAWSAGSADLESPADDKTFGNGRKTAALQAAIAEAAPSRCDPQALAKRPAANGQTMWETEALAMGQSLHLESFSHASLTVQDDCNLVELNNNGLIKWKTDTQGKAKKCALVITGEECDRVGDLALVDMDSGAYLWSIGTSYIRPPGRSLKLYMDCMYLNQQGSSEGLWRSCGKGKYDPVPIQGFPMGQFEQASSYLGLPQDNQGMSLFRRS